MTLDPLGAYDVTMRPGTSTHHHSARHALADFNSWVRERLTVFSRCRVLKRRTRLCCFLAAVVGALASAALVGLAGSAVAASDRLAAATNHWAFQPLAAVRPPAVADPSWCRTPIDRFILARLERAGMRPSTLAPPRTLLRRITFDLIGLPPSPEEVEAFDGAIRRDPRTAVEGQVERLLASPHYGERWGRWWLDVARYADSNGQDENKVMGNAWRYRDWVIRSFNANQPYDRFITEQVAGDLLPSLPVERETLDRLVATGFLVLGPKMLAEQDKPKLAMDIVDEQIDTVGRGFLGLTLGCARCHDHKFDPIPARDYYAMAGIFKSTRTMQDLAFVSKFNERPVSTQAELAAIAAHEARVVVQSNRLAAVTRDANRALVAGWEAEFPRYLAAARTVPPGARPLEAGLDTNVLRRLRVLLETDPATNAVSRLLNEAAADPARAAGLIGQVKRENRGSGSGEGAPTIGLRIGPGRIGAGFLATGANHLELPHRPELDPPELTVEAWVRVDEFPKEGETRRWLVNKNGNEWVEGHYALLVERGQAGAYLNIGGTKEDVFAVWSGADSLTPKHWHHLAFTYDGSDLRLFLDGRAAGELAVHRARVPGRTPLVLGRRQDGYVHFQGGLDEVHVFDRALPAAELKRRFEHPESPAGAGVVARWEFDKISAGDRQELALAEVREALLGAEGALALPKDARSSYPLATRETVARLEAERDALAAAAPPGAALALAVEEDKPVHLPVHLRGSHLTPMKDPVPRGFLQVISRPSMPREIPAGHSGRLELARWLTDSQNPLTARVIVNRIWQAHFGQGLVRTPDNFGLRGDPPTHPELLDWLAAEFLRSGWDVKSMHRLILHSAVYQQSSATRQGSKRVRGEDAAAAPVAGPRGRSGKAGRAGSAESGTPGAEALLGRFPRQRLEAEMIRDALLAVSGRLDAGMGGTLVNWKNNEYVPADAVSAQAVRRTVYLPIVRDRVFDALTIFDFANPSVCSAKRTPTVVSHQALFFLNSGLVKDSALAVAKSLLARGDLDEPARIREAYVRVLNRPATAPEVQRARRFLAGLAASSDGTLEPGRVASPPAGGESLLGDWAALCQTLLACNEFAYRD